jgi:hypothetical protein
LFELSVPFELNVDATHDRKVDRYRQLVSGIEYNGYTVKYFPIEIGSRAFITKDNIARLKSFLKDTTQNRNMNNVKSMICKIVITASFIIYHSKVEDAWVDPHYVSFN